MFRLKLESQPQSYMDDSEVIDVERLGVQPQLDLLSAFRINYSKFERAIQEAVVDATDSTVLARLGDDLDEFANLVIEVYVLYISRTTHL